VGHPQNGRLRHPPSLHAYMMNSALHQKAQKKAMKIMKMRSRINRMVIWGMATKAEPGIMAPLTGAERPELAFRPSRVCSRPVGEGSSIQVRTVCDAAGQQDPRDQNRTA